MQLSTYDSTHQKGYLHLSSLPTLLEQSVSAEHAT